MTKEEYKLEKARVSYELFKQKKFFKKARAIVIKKGKLLALKVTYKETGNIHYLLPGGSVDDGETVKQTVVRETEEEFNIVVKVNSYLGKLYYRNKMVYNNEEFISNRIDYFYICDYIKESDTKTFGVSGEFDRPDRTYERVELSLVDLQNITPSQLNDMNQNVYDKLINYFNKTQH